MGGCFRPSASKQPIHIQLINKILTQSLKSPPLQLNFTLSQRIHKKGDLRKLLDHLSSHKYNISSSLIYLAQLLNDSTNNQPVLVIIKQLVISLPQFLNDEDIPKHSHSSKKKKKQKQKGEIINSRIDGSNSRQIEINFEIMYFPIIMTVFDGDQGLRVEVMESMRVYAEMRTQKFSQDRFVAQMLARLLIQLKMGRLIKESVETYYFLIAKSNVYLAENESHHEALFVILSLWCKQSDVEIKHYCSMISKMYIFECMQEREYLELFSVVLSIYDRHLFKQTALYSLETDLLLSMEEQQMKGQFLKGLFRYLLVYLSLTEDPRVRENWQKVVFTIPYITLKNSHDCILSPQCKLNAFNTLLRWVKLQFIDLNQLINFNRLSLYSCFKSNILGQTSQLLLTKILTTFVDIYTLCNPSSKFLLTQMLVEDIHYGINVSLEELRSLVWLARKFITHGLIIQDLECFNFFKPLECVPEERLKIQEIILMYALLLDSCKMPYNYNIIQSICDVSYSFYDILDISQPTIRQKYSMLQAVLYFMTKLNDKGYSDMVLLWVINAPRPKKPNSITRYFDKLLTLSIWQLITAVKRVPDEMIQLNKQIQTMSNSDIVGEIWVYQKSHPEIQIASRLSPVEQNHMSARYLFVKEKFERLMRRDRAGTEFSEEGEGRGGSGGEKVKRKSSVVEVEHSYKTDESFQEIFGMINSNKQE